MAKRDKRKEKDLEVPDNYMITEDEKKLVEKITRCYRASYQYKESLGVTEAWRDCQDYWAGNVNLPEDEDDPASETNIIQSIIESQVADIVDGTLDLTVKPGGPSDHPFAKDIQLVLKWIWNKNKMIPKLDEGERDRLNLGTICWRVFWDPDAMNSRGLVTIEPCGPETIFPDPKIKKPDRINDGDFFIYVTPYTLRNLIQRFGEKAKLIPAEGNFQSYDPRIFNEADNDGSDEVVNSQALLYEYWEKDEEGKLRRVYMAGGRILEDSFESRDSDGSTESFYNHRSYPYIIIPCYKQKGRLWGLGDTEQLIPTQNIINDLDDQIRMNARLVGNVQTVVGVGAGINLKKWTNKPGLKVLAKDPSAIKEIQPPSIPTYLFGRRNEAFNESELISGRSDVLEGRRSGSLRSASAILALQEAGSRRSKHKKLMLQEGFVAIFDLVLAYVKEFMTEERAIEITEGASQEYLFFKGSSLTEVPVLTRNENFDPTAEADGTERFKPLTDEEGAPMTKEVEVDIEVSFGAGMPNSPSFLYQAALDLVRENLITQSEGRLVLKSILNWPMVDPLEPNGNFVGRNNSAEQLAMVNGQNPADMLGGGTPEEAPPMTAPSMGGSSVEESLAMLEQAMANLPPEILQAFITQLTGGGMGANPQQAVPGGTMA